MVKLKSSWVTAETSMTSLALREVRDALGRGAVIVEAEGVVAVAALERVVAGIAVERVVLVAAERGNRSRCRRAASPAPLVAEQHVIAAAADQEIVVVAADEVIVPALAEQRVLVAVAVRCQSPPVPP